MESTDMSHVPLRPSNGDHSDPAALPDRPVGAPGRRILPKPGPLAQFPPVPRSILALDLAGTILVLGTLRGSTRLLRERYYPMLTTKPAERVLIVGASDTNMTLIRAIQTQPGLGMKVVGLL